MAKRSAGLLMYRYRDGVLEVFLVHPGGPFWAKKDLGAWTIPKGEYGPDETPLAAARREFGEETACPSEGESAAVDPAPTAQRQDSSRPGPFEGDCDPEASREQHLHPGMAPRLRPAGGVPGSRPGGLVHLGGSERPRFIRGQLGFLEGTWSRFWTK